MGSLKTILVNKHEAAAWTAALWTVESESHKVEDVALLKCIDLDRIFNIVIKGDSRITINVLKGKAEKKSQRLKVESKTRRGPCTRKCKTLQTLRF